MTSSTALQTLWIAMCTSCGHPVDSGPGTSPDPTLGGPRVTPKGGPRVTPYFGVRGAESDRLGGPRVTPLGVLRRITTFRRTSRNQPERADHQPVRATQASGGQA